MAIMRDQAESTVVKRLGFSDTNLSLNPSFVVYLLWDLKQVNYPP